MPKSSEKLIYLLQIKFDMIDCHQQIQKVVSQLNSIQLKEDRIKKVRSILKDYIKSERIETWIIVKQLIDLVEIEKGRTERIDPTEEIYNDLRSEIINVKTLPMLLITYWVIVKKKKILTYGIQWSSIYKNLSQKNFELQSFNYWIIQFNNEENPLQKDVQEVLLMFSHVFPAFINNQYINIADLEFDSVLLWLSEMVADENQKLKYACNLIKFLKEAKTLRLNTSQQKEHLILKKIVQLMGQQRRALGNLFLFFDPFTIKEKDVEYFCHIYESYIENLDEQHILNVFEGICNNGVNKEILSFIRKIGYLLHQNQEYFILRVIYERFILPNFIINFKNTKKLEKQVYKVGFFYIVGFLKHCNIGEEGVECILQNIEFINNDQLRRKWAQLAILSCKSEICMLKIKNILKQFKIDIHSEAQIMKKIKSQSIWSVTIRTGRKHKKYQEIYSNNLKGIINRKNQCYIISSVQSLFSTLQLGNIISDFHGEFKRNSLKILDEFWHLFDELRGKRGKKPISVKYLKSLSSQNFKFSEKQEDAHEFMLSLFDQLENQLKSIPQALKIFKSAYQIDYQKTITCENCKFTKKIQNSEPTYIHSFSYKQSFDNAQSQHLFGYYCEKCKQQKCIKITEIKSNHKIMILHINRFTHKEGVLKKNLGNRPIKRQIGNYSLIGFICHKGKSISSGHYIYYRKISDSRWALFNDNAVTEFNLQNQNQQFEKQLKSENTPYILFYKRK